MSIPTAVLSEDNKYRYILSRAWGPGPHVTFIGLNPSTADATTDDPTIRRCIGFAKSWGAGSLVMVNLFAFRSTDPQNLLTTADPIGPENDHWLDVGLKDAEIVVAAWGTRGGLLGRAEAVRHKYHGRLSALKITNSGMPGHPLYIPATARPIPYRKAGDQ